MSRIELLQGDIVKLHVDAIVNAANSTLLGGGGVDGAIHRAAGPELLEECKSLKGCPVGKAKLTKGYKLKAKYVIHTVGPVWEGGNKHEEKFLADAYKNSLILAVRNELKTIAFPCISTGVYNFPKEKAAEIAIAEVYKFLLHEKSIKKVIFNTFDDENYEIYHKKIQELKL